MGEGEKRKPERKRRWKRRISGIKGNRRNWERKDRKKLMVQVIITSLCFLVKKPGGKRIWKKLKQADLYPKNSTCARTCEKRKWEDPAVTQPGG